MHACTQLIYGILKLRNEILSDYKTPDKKISFFKCRITLATRMLNYACSKLPRSVVF